VDLAECDLYVDAAQRVDLAETSAQALDLNGGNAVRRLVLGRLSALGEQRHADDCMARIGRSH
jgi:hypothetical protein